MKLHYSEDGREPGPYVPPTSFVVARLVLIRDIAGESWRVALDSGWSPDQGLGPWVGGHSSTNLEEAFRGFAQIHGQEFTEFLMRSGYPVGS